MVYVLFKCYYQDGQYDYEDFNLVGEDIDRELEGIHEDILKFYSHAHLVSAEL